MPQSSSGYHLQSFRALKILKSYLFLWFLHGNSLESTPVRQFLPIRSSSKLRAAGFYCPIVLLGWVVYCRPSSLTSGLGVSKVKLGRRPWSEFRIKNFLPIVLEQSDYYFVHAKFIAVEVPVRGFWLRVFFIIDENKFLRGPILTFPYFISLFVIFDASNRIFVWLVDFSCCWLRIV